MGKRIQLALVIHNHQPVGNFDHVIADACAHAYLPFLRMLLEFPRVRLGLHTSGCLLEWLEQGCPEYFSLVRELLSRGQLELLGGGMYEPILPILPDADACRQLELMNTYLGDQFGVTPRGMWLAERVWEPHLPQAIAAAGLQYTLLDDYHFRGCALPKTVAREYFTTQHGRDCVALLPIAEKLRYTMPFQAAAETFTYLRTLADGAAATPLAVFGDDGEKFGVWPETYEWVYERGWLRDFLTALTEALDWVDLLLPSEVIDRRRPAGEVYIPCCSYKEMGDWTRIDSDAPDDAPPGHWRNYLAKYSEAQALYQRMLQVSHEVEAAMAVPMADNRWRDIAATQLGRGQCNCAYWHGVFGGLYLNNLRHALNSSLLLAERSVAQHFDQRDSQGRELLGTDDLDGLSNSNRLGGFAPRLRNPNLSVQFSPEHGLALDRLDAYDPPFVWTNVMTRRREHYHQKLGADYAPSEHASIHDRVVVKEDGLQDRLIYDAHPRVSFNCMLGPARIMPQQFELVSAAALARWVRAADDYDSPAAELEPGPDELAASVVLGPLRLRKSARLAGNAVQLHVEGRGGEFPRDQLLWIEFNFNILTDQSDDRYLAVSGERLALATGVQRNSIDSLALCDGWQQRQLVLSCTPAAQLVVYPIYTVSSSEGGFERTYQGSCMMLGFAAAALSSIIQLTLRIEELTHAAAG